MKRNIPWSLKVQNDGLQRSWKRRFVRPFACFLYSSHWCPLLDVEFHCNRNQKLTSLQNVSLRNFNRFTPNWLSFRYFLLPFLIRISYQNDLIFETLIFDVFFSIFEFFSFRCSLADIMGHFNFNAEFQLLRFQ